MLRNEENIFDILGRNLLREDESKITESYLTTHKNWQAGYPFGDIMKVQEMCLQGG